MQNILQFIYTKAFWEISFPVIIYINELFIFEPLVYKFMKKIFFISSNEWNLRKLTIKKKKINIHLTQLNQIEGLRSYSQSDISRPPPFWKSHTITLTMNWTQFVGLRKPEYKEKTTNLSQVTNTFNNITVIPWHLYRLRKPEYLEKSTDLMQVSDKLCTKLYWVHINTSGNWTRKCIKCVI